VGGCGARGEVLGRIKTEEIAKTVENSGSLPDQCLRGFLLFLYMFSSYLFFRLIGPSDSNAGCQIDDVILLPSFLFDEISDCFLESPEERFIILVGDFLIPVMHTQIVIFVEWGIK
jgi:hypothetical protein